MDRIAIFLRNTGNVNKFRRAILSALRIDRVDEALICSGFFQDDHKYSAGADFDLISHRGGTPLTVTTLGLYSYTWRAQYSAFFSQLKAKNPSPCFSAYQKRIPGMSWHAKIFLAKEANRPLVGIIGSSNITRRAFGELHEFNYECDVVMWEETVAEVDSAMEAVIGDTPEFSDVIVTSYDRDHRANRRPLADRLVALEAEILSEAVDV